jgi:hypothetical protein
MTQIMEFPNEKMKQLSTQYANREITMTELDTECAYWYLECFSEIYPKPYPTPPDRYRNYASMDIYEKKEVPNSFWLMSDIKEYLDNKFLIKNENKSVVSNLRKFLACIPESDFVAKSKYNEKIREFEGKDFS